MWADPARNNLTAGLAESLIGTRRCSAAVLAGSPAHAAELGRRLFGWTVVGPEAGALLPVRAVVGEAWLARGYHLVAALVIDARGWGPLGPDDFGPNARLTLVDVPAAGHPAFVARAARRLETYGGYGWAVGHPDDPPDEI